MKFVAITAVLSSAVAFASVGETRKLEGFEGLSLANAVEATVTQGDAYKVKITADSAETMKKVVAEVKGGILDVHLDDSWCFRCEVKVEVVTPRLARLHLSGASKAKVDGTFGPQLDLELSGASKTNLKGLKAVAVKAHASGASTLQLAGQVTALELEASGASTIESPTLIAQNVKADVSGASNVELRAEKGIEADVSGASSIVVRGNPTQRKVDASGASDISWRD